MLSGYGVMPNIFPLLGRGLGGGRTLPTATAYCPLVNGGLALQLLYSGQHGPKAGFLGLWVFFLGFLGMVTFNKCAGRGPNGLHDPHIVDLYFFGSVFLKEVHHIHLLRGHFWGTPWATDSASSF